MSKKVKIEKFNMDIEPATPNLFWHLVEKVGSWYFCSKLFGTGSKINRINCEDLEAPYLVLSTHASFVDFAHNTLAMKKDRSSWVASVDEFIGIRAWLFSKAKVIPKRKFTNDIQLVKKVINATKNKKICMTIYPEARFSLAGVNEDIGTALGKLAKKCKVPVVVVNQKGNFLRSPQWCKHPYRDIPVICNFTQVVTKEEVLNLSAEEIQTRIEEAFVYDDYKYHLESGYKMKCKKRAENIHKILYKCPHCGSEHHMDSKGIKLWCNNCNTIWEMNEYSQLICQNKEDIFTHVPDWYCYEREETKKEVLNNEYKVVERVRVEHLKTARKGFIFKGYANMIHDNDGYHFEGTLDDGTDFTFTKAPETTRSMHIEYDYKERGDALDIVFNNETYFVYPLNKQSNLTKYHFATEEIYKKATSEK